MADHLDPSMRAVVDVIDGGKATLPELRQAGIEALVKALGPVGMASFLQQFDPGRGDYTAERDDTLGSRSVDELVDEIERRRKKAIAK
jgi:hypothetical protein